jgi:hypothetical protein
MVVSQAGKGHVPEENLHEYRRLAQIARQYNTLAYNLSNLGRGFEASTAFGWSQNYWGQANALRVDLPTK